jgi:hypothetical protein
VAVVAKNATTESAASSPDSRIPFMCLEIVDFFENFYLATLVDWSMQKKKTGD